MINLATIGTSKITEKFVTACKKTGKYNFSTSYSRSEATAKVFAEKYEFTNITTDILKLAEDTSIDAVYIASPNVFHYYYSKLFLQNGKHVICEKPIVTNVQQFTELHDLSYKNNVVYMEAIMSRYSEGHEILHTAIDSIGDISLARIDFSQLSSRYSRFKNGEHVNIFDMSLGAGTLMDLGIYCVWSAIDLFGSPDNISATASFLPNHADSSGVAVFNYKRFPAVLSYSKIGQSYSGSEIIGTQGTIKISSISQYCGISLIKDGKESIIYDIKDHIDSMCGEAYKFADFINNTNKRNELHDINSQTFIVHKCMDAIKLKANIQYNLKEVFL